jgi:arylsulfatase A-like enzyme
LRWLEHPSPRPFFAFLNCFDAHAPYFPSKSFETMFGPTTPRDSLIPSKQLHTKNIPPDLLQSEMNAYDGTIAYLDHEGGLLLDELGERSLLENTLVIIASGHGEEFGEHDVFSHGYSLYVPSRHVPLLILYPERVPAGKSVGAVVSLRDMAATVMDLTNGFPKGFPLSKGNLQSLTTNSHPYIKNGDGREELYDWQADPWEPSDVSGTENGRGPRAHFRNLLKSNATG